MKLYAPQEYFSLTKEAKEEICNGCGPKGIWKFFIKNILKLICGKEACNIHDYMYHVGENLEDKKQSDRVFLNNLIRIIDSTTKYRFMLGFKFKIAKMAYKFVKDFGGKYFWDNKNKSENYQSVR